MAIALSSSSGSDAKNLPGTSSSSSTSAAPATTTTTIASAIGIAATLNETGNAVTTACGKNIEKRNSNNNNSSGSPSITTGAGLELKKGHTGEMVGGCAVCLDENGSDDNMLVYCDGCELAVHQACYGIVNIPTGSWFCCRCASGNTQTEVKCILCPAEDGAFKKTETGAWAHVLCALYIPEAGFGNHSVMEPIIVKGIIPIRFNQVCYICEENGESEKASYGAKIECENKKKGCKRFFHVTCGHAAGLLVEKQSKDSDSLNYYGFCKHHFRKLKAPSSNNSKRKENSFTNNPNSSSILDSASDSSQDNDSRHTSSAIQEQDKNRTRVHPTTNISQLDPTIPTSSIQSLSSPTISNLTAGKPTTAQAKITPMSLAAQPNSTSGKGSKSSSATSSTTSTPQKKRRTTKTTQGQNNTTEQQPSNSETLLVTASSHLAIPENPTIVGGNATANFSGSQDVYDWPSGSKNPDRSHGKANRKKPSTPGAQLSNIKSVPSNNQQAAGYNPNKISSPNLSISTSPSSASPANSTKSSTSSSSSASATTLATTVTATATSSSSSSSSSSASTTSSSPSPALLSPSLPNRGSTIRHESPLASSSKTGSNASNKTGPEPILAAGDIAPALNPLISTRINLDKPRPDMRKNSAVSSSLLSTVLPMPSMESPIQPGMGSGGDASAEARIGSQKPIDGSAKGTTVITSTTTSKPENAQPTIPPLIIPVPQMPGTNAPAKPTPKTRAPARNTKKKAAEANITATTQKPEPKTKPIRARKAVVAENSATPTLQKAEPKGRKSKASTRPAGAIASSSSVKPVDVVAKTSTTTTGPTKRKSRAASAESNPNTVPTPPVKRIRKKKTDTLAPSTGPEIKSTSQTALGLQINPQPPLGQSGAAGPGPLMINTPTQNNPLPPGYNIADGHNGGQTKYFSPMVSPYTNYDSQMAASSLSRSSLSRLFTSSSSSVNAANPANHPLDDPTKAFDDLRDYSWSHLSKCVLDHAQQFDIPMLIGTLYTLRAENEKLHNRVRDLTLKREQLAAMNARLDLPPQLLTQNLANTSMGFSSIVSNLTNNSPKSLHIPSPGSALGKQPLVITSSYNSHMGGPGHIGPSGFVDRSSPLAAQTHSTINNIKSSSISTPSPPISALIAAAHNNSNRAGLTVNQPYMPNSYPQLNSTGQINSTPQGSSFYVRQ